jgi:hypothetical protein
MRREPCVLLYGHMDKQPPLADQWEEGLGTTHLPTSVLSFASANSLAQNRADVGCVCAWVVARSGPYTPVIKDGKVRRMALVPSLSFAKLERRQAHPVCAR